MTAEELTTENSALKSQLAALERECDNWIQSVMELTDKLSEFREQLRAVLEALE